MDYTKLNDERKEKKNRGMGRIPSVHTRPSASSHTAVTTLMISSLAALSQYSDSKKYQ